MSPFSKIANQVINHSTLVPGNNNAPGKHVPVPLLLPPSPRSGNTDRKPPKERKLDYISLFNYFVMLSKNYYISVRLTLKKCLLSYQPFLFFENFNPL